MIPPKKNKLINHGTNNKKENVKTKGHETWTNKLLGNWKLKMKIFK